jgi:hypothetical protein
MEQLYMHPDPAMTVASEWITYKTRRGKVGGSYGAVVSMDHSINSTRTKNAVCQ